jgi:hypothetical protein
MSSTGKAFHFVETRNTESLICFWPFNSGKTPGLIIFSWNLVIVCGLPLFKQLPCIGWVQTPFHGNPPSGPGIIYIEISPVSTDVSTYDWMKLLQPFFNDCEETSIGASMQLFLLVLAKWTSKS